MSLISGSTTLALRFTQPDTDNHPAFFLTICLIHRMYLYLIGFVYHIIVVHTCLLGGSICSLFCI